MESRIKFRISNIFRTCRSQNVREDIINQPTFFHHCRDFHPFDLPSTGSFTTESFPPSICRPKFLCDDKTTVYTQVKRVDEQKKMGGKISNGSRKEKHYHYQYKEEKSLLSSPNCSLYYSSSPKAIPRKNCRRKICKKSTTYLGLCPLSPSSLEGKVGESFAFVKRSIDPRGDFRKSMVEMIIEKQIFSAKDLEQLLYCFLTLNSSCHHEVIVEVFWEIWDTLNRIWQ